MVFDPSAATGPGDAGRRLIVMRHGRTAWNAEGRAQGHADVGLDEQGHEQAKAAAAYLATLEPTGLWTSDLTRARETCAYLEDATGLTATQDSRLREFDVGPRQGMTNLEFAERHPEAHAAWMRGDGARRLPGSEPDTEVESRMRSALRECLDALGPAETGIVVTHGASLKVGIAALLNWPRAMATSLRGLDNCAWVTVEELRHGGRLRMAGYNESVRPGHDAPARLPDEV